MVMSDNKIFTFHMHEREREEDPTALWSEESLCRGSAEEATEGALSILNKRLPHYTHCKCTRVLFE